MSDKFLRQDALRDLLQAMEPALMRTGIDFYLVGAVARDIWFEQAGEPTPRTTRDIDFAVLVPDEIQFENLKQQLIEHPELELVPGAPMRLGWRNKWMIDLLPFGEIQDENGRVVLSGGRIELQSPGFREVYDFGLENYKGEFRYCSIPALVLLKLLSWRDRPEMRSKDVKDIHEILRLYANHQIDKIWEHSDLLAKKMIYTWLLWK